MDSKRRLWAAVALFSMAAAVTATGQSTCVRQSSAPASPAPSSHPSQSASRTLSRVTEDEMRALINAAVQRASRQVPSSRQLERVWLHALYAETGSAPLWIDDGGRPSGDAREMLELLRGAALEGLDPADYEVAELDAHAAVLDANQSSAAAMADFDVRLSQSTLRYFRHLHLGRIDPRAIGFRMVVPVERHDFAEVLRSALAHHRIRKAARDLAPPLVQYRGLRAMLARYRALASRKEHESLALPATGTVKPGEPHAGLRLLHRRLIALGDLPEDTPAPDDSALYDGVLVDGVRRFQIRHGLQADGILGKATQHAMRVPLSWRVRQIEQALERLRWLPDLGDERLLAVNIPMFSLWGWDSIRPEGIPSFGMGVIVGRAVQNQTPVFVSHVRTVIFRPYWDVPASIARGEILPAIARDAEYLHRQNMEIVRGYGERPASLPPTPENLALLGEGKLRLRQRPGPRNALGLVKFVFPNEENVYLHATPAQELFSRARRDFSHGCVRVEDPVGLAEWALKEQPEWTRERILDAMQGDHTRHVNLTRPIRVILFYTTAAFMPDDKTIRFADDIYGHDARLDRALQALEPVSQPIVGRSRADGLISSEP